MKFTVVIEEYGSTEPPRVIPAATRAEAEGLLDMLLAKAKEEGFSQTHDGLTTTKHEVRLKRIDIEEHG